MSTDAPSNSNKFAENYLNLATEVKHATSEMQESQHRASSAHTIYTIGAIAFGLLATISALVLVGRFIPSLASFFGPAGTFCAGLPLYSTIPVLIITFCMSCLLIERKYALNGKISKLYDEQMEKIRSSFTATAVELDKASSEKDDELSDAKREIDKLKASKIQARDRVAQKKDQIKNLEASLAEKESEIVDLKASLEIEENITTRANGDYSLLNEKYKKLEEECNALKVTFLRLFQGRKVAPKEPQSISFSLSAQKQFSSLIEQFNAFQNPIDFKNASRFSASGFPTTIGFARGRRIKPQLALKD